MHALHPNGREIYEVYHCFTPHLLILNQLHLFLWLLEEVLQMLVRHAEKDFLSSLLCFIIITIRIIIILHVTRISCMISCSHVYAGPSGDQRFSFSKSISLVLTGRVCKNIGKYVKFWCCEVNIWDWSESTKHIGRDVEILMLQNLQAGLGGPQPI